MCFFVSTNYVKHCLYIEQKFINLKTLSICELSNPSLNFNLVVSNAFKWSVFLPIFWCKLVISTRQLLKQFNDRTFSFIRRWISILQTPYCLYELKLLLDVLGGISQSWANNRLAVSCLSSRFTKPFFTCSRTIISSPSNPLEFLWNPREMLLKLPAAYVKPSWLHGLKPSSNTSETHRNCSEILP